MKLIKLLFLITILFQLTVHAEKKVLDINFKNLQIEDLVKITSKILNKNILLSHKIAGKVDFVSNKKVYEDDILNILIYVLAEKGFTIVDNNDILRIVRLGEASKYNLPVFSEKTKKSYTMVTNVFELDDLNVDYVASKIAHLIGKSARVVTDKKSNSLVITDFVDNIKTIKEVINHLSKDNKKDVEMIKLEYTKAEVLSLELRNLAKSIFDETITNQKVSIFVNKDTNSIILVGKKENIKVLDNYIKRVDIKGSLAENITEVIGLKNTEAKSIITLLNNILGKKVYKNPELKPFVAVDEETNTVVIMGPKSEVELIKQLIDKLDIDRPQVYVKAQIIEVSDKRSQEIGVKYGLVGGGAGSDGLVSMAANLGSTTNLNSELLGLLDSGIAGIKIPSNLSAVMGLNVAVNLLKSNNAADVISEPSILAINNKESSIYVGERRSIKTSVTGTGDDKNTSFSREDIGLTLSVKPRISNDEKVILEIKTLLEGVISGENTDQPTTTKKEVKTSAIVTTGESVILGGLTQKKTTESVQKIPLLGDIPVLGQLFRNNVDENDKVSLVVILTPYIVSKSSDLSNLRNQLAELAKIEKKYLEKLKEKVSNKNENKNEDIKLENKQEKQNTSNNSDNKHQYPEDVRQMFNL